jgi:MFS family permease
VAITFTAFIGFSAPLPVLPDDVHQRLDGSDALLGLVIGAFPVFALLGRFLAGWMADHRGRRITLGAGLACCAGAGVMLLFPLPAPLLVAARGLQGLADALAYTACVAWVLDIVPAERRTASVALLGGGVWGGYAAGPLVGLLLGDLTNVGIFVVLAALAGAPLVLRMPAPPQQAGARVSVPARDIARVVAMPGLGIGLLNVSYAAIIGFLVVHLQSRGGHGALVLALFSATVLLGRIVVVPLAQRIGLVRGVLLAVAAIVGGTVAIGESTDVAVAAVAAVLYGLGYCLPYPVMAALVTTRLPAAGRARALGSLVAIYDACVGFGAVVLGQVSEAQGTRAVFRTAAAVSVVGAAVCVSVIRTDARAGLSSAEGVLPEA